MFGLRHVRPPSVEVTVATAATSRSYVVSPLVRSCACSSVDVRSAAGVALFGDGCCVAGFADQLVVWVVGDDVFGFGFQVAWFGEEEGRVAAGLFVFAEGDDEAFEAVRIAAFADDLELVAARGVFVRDALVEVAEACFVGGDSLFA